VTKQLFFFIKYKNCIDKKKKKTSWRPAVNIYRQTQAKETDSLEQTISKISLLNKKAKGIDSREQPKIKGNRLP
jgi:hypothetical protein